MPVGSPPVAEDNLSGSSLLEKINPLQAIQHHRENKKLAEWANQKYENCRMERQRYERQWYVNLAFYFGKQNISVLSNPANNLGFSFQTPNAPPWRVRMVINKTRSVIRRETAKLTSSKPVPVVIPSTTEDEDQSASRVGETILKAAMSDLEFDKTRRSWVWWGSVCGTSFIKSYWNGDAVDELSNQRGKIDIERVAPFYVFVPDLLEEDIENQPYVIHAMTKSPEWVKNTYGYECAPNAKAAGNLLEDKFLHLVGADTQKNDSCLLLEVWVKPGGHPSFPKGGFFTVIGEQIVQRSDVFPYDHNEYPFYKFDGIPTGAFYGDSVISDLIPVQKEYNRTRSQMIEFKNAALKPRLLAQKGAINPRQITTEPGQTLLYTPGFEQPKYLDPPPMPSGFINEVQLLQTDMDDMSSQHEISRGSTPNSQITAATAISYLQEQDDSTLSYQVASIEHAIAKLGRHYLKYVTQFWQTPRIVRLVGKDSVMEAGKWQANDLRGNTDVRVQAGSALPQSKAAKQAYLMELAKMGFIPPEQMLEMLDIGGIEKVMEDYLVDKRQAQRENLKMSNMDPMQVAQALMQMQPEIDSQTGEDVGAEPPFPANSWDNHQVHIHLHNQFRKTQEFELLPEPLQQMFEMHVMTHQYAMMEAPQPDPVNGNTLPPAQDPDTMDESAQVDTAEGGSSNAPQDNGGQEVNG